MASGRASGSKRPLDCDEIEKISEIHSPSKKARVHGVLASVSPMKSSNRGSKYFLTDGVKAIRFVGFDTSLQQKLRSCISGQEGTCSNHELRDKGGKVFI